jgi:hypothetical protein
LSDPQKRRKYDRGGIDAVKNSHDGEGFDPFDIFGGMFGGGGRKGERRDSDTRIKIKVGLKDLYLGREYEVFKNFKFDLISLRIQEILFVHIVEEMELILTMIFMYVTDVEDKVLSLKDK